jgi:hypothetical protein
MHIANVLAPTGAGGVGRHTVVLDEDITFSAIEPVELDVRGARVDVLLWARQPSPTRLRLVYPGAQLVDERLSRPGRPRAALWVPGRRRLARARPRALHLSRRGRDWPRGHGPVGQ